MKTSSKHEAQVGALPVRGATGGYEVLLITSRDTGRWIIPKGWPMRDIADHDAAALEAFEEAGVKGKVHKHPLGAFTYEKRFEAYVRPIRVMVYLLEVKNEKDRWREQDRRRREWMTVEAAAQLVDEPGLSEILLRLNTRPDARRAKL